MKKINVAKLLKDCPQNMELDCTMFNKVTLFTVDDREGVVFPITVFREDGNPIVLTKYGQYTDADFAKCVIFPKGKTTWEGFHRPFEDGDIIYTKHKLGTEFISIFQIEYERDICTYWDINLSTNKLIGNLHEGNAFKVFIEKDKVKEQRFATEEEKERLFRAIKDNGYQWNTETKTLEKLPKFKVGDKIRNVIVNLGIHTVLNVDTSGYAVKKDDQYGNFRVNFDGEKNWELVPDVKPFDKVGDRIKSVMSSSNKFDIKTLKPFDKVLMRPSNAREWVATFYSHYSNNKFYGCGMCCSQCIPYEGNEHLLGTTDDCDTFCKTSE